MDNSKIIELMILCKLEMSILTNGKIKPDNTGYFASDIENDRLDMFYKLQEKYHYGWYIAEQPIEEQLQSINDF